jgi:hypothetical protein
MSTMEERIDAFLSAHNLGDSVKDELCNLVSGCFEDMFKHLMSAPVPESSKKISKTEKIEDVSSVESEEQLKLCTTTALSQYCKNNKLRAGGTKKDIIERVWRHIQGSSSEDDNGRSAKTVKAKAVIEKHECFGCNSKGAPCATGANEQFGGQWFCWRHITDANDIIKKKMPESEASSSTAEPEPVVKKMVKKVVKVATESESEPEPVVKKMVKKVKKVVTELTSE